MQVSLNKFMSLLYERVSGFRRRQNGIVAVEYAIVIGCLSVLVFAALSENGILHELFYEVWQIISTKVLSALDTIA